MIYINQNNKMGIIFVTNSNFDWLMFFKERERELKKRNLIGIRDWPHLSGNLIGSSVSINLFQDV